MSMKSKTIDSLKKKVLAKASKTYPKKLDVTAPKKGISLMNHCCHYNAVNAVKTGVAVAVVECVMIESDRCYAHCINLLEDGSYVDLTLGWAWSGCDYRLVRFVHESEYKYISKKLGDLKANLASGFIYKRHEWLGIDKWDLS